MVLSVAVGVVGRVIGGSSIPKGMIWPRFRRSQTSCARSLSGLAYMPLLDAASACKALCVFPEFVGLTCMITFQCIFRAAGYCSYRNERSAACASCMMRSVVVCGMQYFTLLHEFRRIPPESHGMLEFHWESAGMVGMCHSCGFPWIPSGIPGRFHGNSRMIPMDSQWNSSGISMEIPPKFQNDSKWNLYGIPMSSKFNQCKNRVQYQHILKTYLSGSHMGQVQT